MKAVFEKIQIMTWVVNLAKKSSSPIDLIKYCRSVIFMHTLFSSKILESCHLQVTTCLSWVTYSPIYCLSPQFEVSIN